MYSVLLIEVLNSPTVANFTYLIFHTELLPWLSFQLRLRKKNKRKIIMSLYIMHEQNFYIIVKY